MYYIYIYIHLWSGEFHGSLSETTHKVCILSAPCKQHTSNMQCRTNHTALKLANTFFLPNHTRTITCQFGAGYTRSTQGRRFPLTYIYVFWDSAVGRRFQSLRFSLTFICLGTHHLSQRVRRSPNMVICHPGPGSARRGAWWGGPPPP